MNLIEWARKGDVEEVRKCIQNGADVNSVNNGWTTALTLSSSEGCTEIVKLLLENGANVHIRSGLFSVTALMLASFNGHTETVKLLLEYGADLEANDNQDWTPLMWAIKGGYYKSYPRTLKILLENGADLETKNHKGETVFMLVAHWAHFKTLNILQEEVERRKQVKMARYTLLRHINIHLAQEIALRTN